MKLNPDARKEDYNERMNKLDERLSKLSDSKEKPTSEELNGVYGMHPGYDFYAFFDGGFSKKRGAYAFIIKDQDGNLLDQAASSC